MDNKEKKPTVVKIGQRIQKYRSDRKLTQDQVAELAGISQKHLSRIEQGYHNPRFDMIIQIANALNIPTDALARDLSDNDVCVFFESIRPYIEKMNSKQLNYIKKNIELFCDIIFEDNE